MVLDRIDRDLLSAVQHDSTRSTAKLGAIVGLSTSATHERLKKLEAASVILGYHARVDPKMVGLDVTAFIHVLLRRPKQIDGFLKAVPRWPEVLECHHVTSDFSYLLKVRTRDTAALEAFLHAVVKTIPGVIRTQTEVALSATKETMAVPTTL